MERADSPAAPSAPVRQAVLLCVLVAAAHVGTIVVARLISRTTTEGVPLWAAAGVSLSVLLLAPRRLWAPVLAVVFATNAIANLVLDVPADVAVGGAIANTIEPLVGALVVLGSLGGSPVLNDRRHLAVFLAGAGVIGPAIGALAGAASIQLAPAHPPFPGVLGRWFTGDALGVLVVASLVLAFAHPHTITRRSPYARWEAAAVGAAVLGLTWLAFWGSWPVLAYLALPPLAYSAIRFSVRGATLSGLAVAVIADAATIRGHGLFVVLIGKGEHEALWQLQLYLAVLLVASLVLAVQVAEIGVAQQAVRAVEEQQRLSSLLESSPDPILVVRADSTVVYANEQFAQLIHRRRDELLGRPFVQFINANRRGGVLEVLEHMEQQPVGSRSTFEMSGLGEVLERALEAAVTPIELLDGRVLVATIRDVTERNAAEAALRAARDAAEAATTAKTQFLATMSHEIRTPMSAVTNLIELLGQTALDDEQRDLLTTMRGSSSALLRIIDDTLDFSKIEAGRLEIESIPMAIDVELAAVASLMEPGATSKGITLSCATVPARPPVLLGDPLRIRQVLLNLVSNAVKFTDDGVVEVVAAVRDGADAGDAWLELTVRDTGIGMDADQKAAVFHPYTQAEHDTTRVYGGTGLGLSIVNRLVELMHGTIDVDSSPGKGSTFTVVLHLKVAPGDAILTAPTPSEPVDPERLCGHVVLVAEDNAVNRDVLLRQLASLGCGAVIAVDGREALDRLAGGGISLVITDCHMPVLDGFGLALAIRRNEQRAVPPAHLPIVAITASAVEGERERCIDAGMDECLSKPVGVAGLAEVLARLLPPEPVRPASTFDLTTLREIVGDDDGAMEDVLASFSTSVRAAADQARAAVADGDGARARDAAHVVVGAARAAGAGRLASLACAVELGATSSSPASLECAVRWLVDETDVVTDAVAMLRAGS